MAFYPEDGRPYVSLGKLFVQQRRFDEALALYEEGCTATGAPPVAQPPPIFCCRCCCCWRRRVH